MNKYLVTDIQIKKDKYVFYLLDKKSYQQFLKNSSETDKVDYLKYSADKNVEQYHSFKELFDVIKEKNITIVDTYELDY